MKIAIAGYASEGKPSYRYFLERGHEVTIVDERNDVGELPEGAVTLLGAGVFERLQGFDMVIRTAGLAPRKIVTDGQVWSATNEFFAQCPAPIIGVTGSKGKGTTASLIASVLQAAGKTVHLVGNIGVPALDVLPTITPTDIVVYELSSFQLWDIQKSPHVAVVLMIEADHLDVHTDMEDYVTAKSQITRHQSTGDTVVYNAANSYATDIAQLSAGSKVGYQAAEAAHVQDGYFWYGEQELCSVEALRLPGVHNQDNACAAIDASWVYTQDVAAITSGISSFSGLPHRLKFVREVNSVKYYDDSIATTPGSAIAAIRAFTEPKVLIVGGSSKGADYTPLVAEIIASDSMRAVVAVGKEGPVIAQLLRDSGAGESVNTTDAKDIVTIVAKATACAQPGDVVVLSPACASFDMFRNYVDRGDQFIAAVGQLPLAATIET